MSSEPRDREPSGLAPLASEVLLQLEQKRQEEMRLCTLRLRGQKYETLLGIDHVNGRKQYVVSISGQRIAFEECNRNCAVSLFIKNEIWHNELKLIPESSHPKSWSIYENLQTKDNNGNSDDPDEYMLRRVYALVKIVETGRVLD